MKVALVLTGLLRCYEAAYPSFKQYFLDRYDVDVYFDIWSEVGYYSGKGYTHAPSDTFISTASGDRGFHTSGELVDANGIIQRYNPVVLRIEDFSTVESLLESHAAPFVNAFTRPKNTVAQAYKIWRGMQLIESSLLHYDVVVRSRPDLFLETDPDQFLTARIMEDLAMNGAMLTLPSRNKMGSGTGDSLLIASTQNAITFAYTQFGNLPVLYQQYGVSCPHIFAQGTIKMMPDVRHVELPSDAHIIHSPKGLYQEPD